MSKYSLSLNKNARGPDHLLSADPDELKIISEKILQSSLSIGSHIKNPIETQEHINNIRRNINARVDIAKGSIITMAMLSFKRPFCGLSPSAFGQVIGSVATENIPADAPISLDMFKNE